jgi:hypothetical protein
MTLAIVVGLVVFAGVRLGSLSAPSGSDPWSDPGTTAWPVVPMLFAYVGATSIGLVLLGDSVTRWWWLPATLFVMFDLPFEAWIGSSSVVTSNAGAFVGSALDLTVMLAPAAVLTMLTTRTRVALTHERIVPSIAIVATCVLLAMLVGIEGPDASTAALAMLAFGILSQSWSGRRAAVFVAIALSLGGDLPGSLAMSLSQGSLGSVAIRDGSVDFVIALLAFSIAPLAHAWARVLGRRSGVVAAATHGS